MTAADSSRPGGFPLLSYLTSAHRLNQLPDDSGAEIVIAGRSNAGKSTALNRIVGRNNLARTSKTPGRTQQLIVFTAADGRRIVDLPGYGFARVPESLRRHWQQVVNQYLQRRESLVGLLLVMDVRRTLRAQDEQLIAWCAAADLPVHVLLTKSDKLGRSAAKAALLGIAGGLAALYPQASLQLFSGISGDGVDQARAVMLDWWRKKDGPGSK